MLFNRVSFVKIEIGSDRKILLIIRSRSDRKFQKVKDQIKIRSRPVLLDRTGLTRVI